MSTEMINIINSLELFPKEITNIISNYETRPITIGIKFEMDDEFHGQIFIDLIEKDIYKIMYNKLIKTKDYNYMKCLFNTVSLKKFIINIITYKNRIDNIDLYFVNTKIYGYKNLTVPIELKNRGLLLQEWNINKYNDDDDSDDEIDNVDPDTFEERFIEVLDKYLNLQPDITI